MTAVAHKRAFAPTHHICLLGCMLVALLLAGCAGKEPVVVPPRPAPPVAQEPLPDSVGMWQPLVRKLIAQGFDKNEMVALFSRPALQYDPSPMRTKLKELLRLHFNRARTRKIQQALDTMGFDPGPVDGLSGKRTRLAIEAYEQAKGKPLTGEADDSLLASLESDLARPKSQWPVPPADFTPIASSPESAGVYKGVLTPKQLAASLQFYRQHYGTLLSMQQRYGVPPELAVAIFTVETRLGEFLGGRKAFATLASMALSADFDVVRPYLSDMPMGADEVAFMRETAAKRGDWAYGELTALIRYAENGGEDPLSIPGSVYGAIGLGQFMPSNAVAYGVDGDSDGDVDLFTLEDAVMSFGNFLQAMGWKGDMRDPEQRRKVLLRYNRSNRYVNTVLAVADYLVQNGG